MLKQLARIQVRSIKAGRAMGFRPIASGSGHMMNSNSAGLLLARRQYSHSSLLLESSASRFSKSEKYEKSTSEVETIETREENTSKVVSNDKNEEMATNKEKIKTNPAEGKAYSLTSIEFEISSAQEKDINDGVVKKEDMYPVDASGNLVLYVDSEYGLCLEGYLCSVFVIFLIDCCITKP